MKKRILLIEPPYYRLFKDTYSLVRYPLSLGYLAGEIISKTDWVVKAYNADFNPISEEIKVKVLAGEGFNNYLKNLHNVKNPIWNEIKKEVIKFKPNVVGISVKSPNFASGCTVAQVVKKIDKKILVIMGGPHISMVKKDALECQNIDIGVFGEGEETLVDLLQTLEKRKSLKGVKGILFRDKNKIVENPPRDFIKDINKLSYPHINAPNVLIDYKKYPLSAFQYLFAIRGCPNNCFFCGSRMIWSRKVRFRSVENIVNEIKSLQKLGLNTFHFDDDTFGVSKQNIFNICESLSAFTKGIKWSCELPVRLIDEETIHKMKKAGCYLIQVGIESGSNEILKAMRKNITIEQALTAAKIIKKSDIMLQTFFMVGFPQETEQTLNDTLYAMKKIKSDYIVYSIFTPYPGTEIFEFCKEHNLVNESFDVSLYNHQSPQNCFCLNIGKPKFRRLLGKVESRVDRVNRINYLKRMFFTKMFEKAKGILTVK